MIDFVSLTDVPTPYRVHYYNALHAELLHRGISSQVWFMGWTARHRNWYFTPDELPSGSRVLPGTLPYIKGQQIPINPAVVPLLIRHHPRYLLMSAGWFYPTNQLALVLTSLTRTKVIFWSESNLEYMERPTGLSKSLRKWTMNRFDAFAVPGQMAQEYVEAHLRPQTQKPIFRMPNVVNEQLFRDRTARLKAHRQELLCKWNVDDGQRPILIIVARLVPIKGIDRLLKALLAGNLLSRMTLLIAGDGPQRSLLEQMIQDALLLDHVRFLGYQEEQTILELLSLADAFVLPSVGDPYPLSAIEAAFAGKPLLLSNKVGCHPELLHAGLNGLLFDPYNEANIVEVFRTFIHQSPKLWEAMGRHSLYVSNERFTTEMVVSQFVDNVLKLG